jgi:hypothetical protein
MMEPVKLSAWEIQQAQNARHRALILQILNCFSGGLTTQQLVKLELETYGYTFLSDNRLRELKAKGFVRKDDSVSPCRWVSLKEAV